MSVLAAVLALAQQPFPYARIGGTRPFQDAIAAQGGVVYATGGGTPRSVAAFGPGGATRSIALPRGTQDVETIDVTSKLLVVQGFSTHGWQVVSGPLNGPLRVVRRGSIVDVAATGSTLLMLRGRHTQQIWAGRRSIGPALPGLTVLRAAGHYAAVEQGRRIRVFDIRTAKQAYSVLPRVDGDYQIGADGRVVVLDEEFERVQTATPAHPRLTTIARVWPAPYDLAIAGGEIAFVERLGDTTSHVVLIKPDGTRRAVTPAMLVTGSLAYDGRTLAFESGTCLYAGAVPATEPATAPADDCQPPR